MMDTLYLPTSSKLEERLAKYLVWGIAVVVTATFVWIVGDVLKNGLGGLSVSFITESPSRGGREGGILPIIVSTLAILAVAMAVAIPLGLATAILLAEFTRRDNWFSVVVARSLDVLAAVPSIVFGLFGNAFFCVWLGMGYSILAGGLTLACMVLPILIRSLEAALRAVPDESRFAASALGMSKTRTVLWILLPCASPGLVVGLVLGIGRVLAETAALLFTSGYVDRMPDSVMDSGRAISIHIFDLAMNVPGGEPNAYSSAVVLITLLLLINGLAAWGTDRWVRKISGGRTS